ncbi:oligosaccharide flippase family protein [Tenacibaculum singaporense]|uniref:oligosaccharide flippase family protein n=1 Tax=Tenacibaculum singaporense TaxID=2358479 RepID=UPI000F65F41D|nr:oligosaccharide flippase family protein [Tenacibaculum singaporense]RSC93570.1 hypothetical protein EI424_10225 [Tenacibaculum singaporense]
MRAKSDKIFKLIKGFKESDLIRDSFWSLLGNVFFKGLSLLSGIFIARFLGKDIFGEYGMIKNTLISVALFSTFGFGYTVTKFIAEYREKNKDIIRLITAYVSRITIIVSGTIAILIFTFSDYIATQVLKASNLNDSIKIMSVLVVFNAYVTLQLGILSGLGRFKKIAELNIRIGLITFICSVSFTYFLGLNGALLSLLVVQIVNIYFNHKLIGKYNNFSLKKKSFNDNVLRDLVLFSIPLALQEIVFSITYWLSNLLIVKYTSYGELGLYNATLQWTSIILFIPGILRNVVLSHLSLKNKDDEGFSETIKVTLLINFVMTLLPATFVFLFADLISNFYGDSFRGFSRLIRIALISTVFISISNIFVQIYMSKGNNWLMFGLRCFKDIAIIIVFLLLINHIDSGAKSMVYSVVFVNIVFLGLVVGFYKSRFFKR